MDTRDIDRIRHYANTDVIRRLMIRYFLQKGYGNSFDRQVYPPALQDITGVIPELGAKLEVIPHALDVNPILGTAKVGWNMFVLGNQRIFLGESYHDNLTELARQLAAGAIQPVGDVSKARKQTTPRRIISFVTRVLERHDGGYVNLSNKATSLPAAGPGQRSDFKPQLGGPFTQAVTGYGL